MIKYAKAQEEKFAFTVLEAGCLYDSLLQQPGFKIPSEMSILLYLASDKANEWATDELSKGWND